ncbi:MAG TPA: DUF1348 family protein [Mycobacterium sp.]
MTAAVAVPATSDRHSEGPGRGQFYRSYGNELWEFTTEGLSPASGWAPVPY